MLLRKKVFSLQKMEFMKKIRLLDKLAMTGKFMAGEISLVMDMAIDPEGKESVERDGKYWVFSDGERVHCRFSEGDSVPVMMSYEDAGLDYSVFGGMKGWNDKKSADARYMPHKFVVDGVRCVRVWDFTEEDAVRAGIVKNRGGLYRFGGDAGGFEVDWKVMLRRVVDKMFKVPYMLNPWIVLYDMTPVIVDGKDRAAEREKALLELRDRMGRK